MDAIEYCTNVEWMQEFGPCRNWADDDVPEYFRAARRVLETDPRAIDLHMTAAQGQRILLHGWNGAHFTHRVGGFGTFCDLTSAQLEVLDAADDAGRAVDHSVENDEE